MPVPFQYPETSWSQRKLRTRGDVEANIQRRAQSSGVRGWSDETLETNHLNKDWRNSHEQQRR
jgi:hypothetical protein